MQARLDDILVEFECAECNLTVEIPVTEIIEIGNPVCTICKANPEMFYGDATILEWK